jgi:hypothetical protein
VTKISPDCSKAISWAVPWRHMGEKRYSSTILNLSCRREEWSVSHPCECTPEYPLDRRLSGIEFPITIFTKALHWSLTWTKSIHPIPPHPISLRSNYILLTILPNILAEAVNLLTRIERYRVHILTGTLTTGEVFPDFSESLQENLPLGYEDNVTHPFQFIIYPSLDAI